MPSTLAVIEEFLSSRSVPVLRNAATALGALASDTGAEHRQRARESLHRLARLALSDPEQEVRDHAAETLLLAVESNPEACTEAAKFLGAETSADGRRRAYALLSKLRARDAIGPPTGWVGSLRRLRLVASITTLPEVEKKAPFRWRYAWLVAAGSLAGAFLLVLLGYLRLSPLEEGVVPTLLIVASVIGASIGLFAGYRSIPIHRHYDRLAGGLVQLVRACAWSALPAAVLGLCFLILTVDDIDGSPWLVWVGAAIGVSVFVVVTRLGSLLAYGLATGSRSALAVHTGSGAAFGLLALSALAWLFILWVPESDWSEVVCTSWALLAPVALGLGFLFARVDCRSTPRRRLLGWIRLPVVGLAIAACAGAVLWQLVPARDERGQQLSPSVVIRPDEALSRSFPRTHDVEFEVEFGQALISKEHLPVYRAGALGKTRVASQSGPDGTRLTWLEPGEYALTLASKPEEGRLKAHELSDFLPLFLDLDTGGADAGAPPQVATPTVRVVFNAFGGPLEEAPREDSRATSGAFQAMRWRVNQAPDRFPFAVDAPLSVFASLPDRSASVPDLVLSLMDGEKALERGDDPPVVRGDLPAGEDFALLVGKYGGASSKVNPPLDLILLLNVEQADWQLTDAAE